MRRRYSTSVPWGLRVLFAAGAVGVGCALVVEGLTHAPDAADTGVTAGAPIADGTHAYQVPAHTVVLTFDGGPDPTWTPRVLDVLERHHAHGTFFVTGALAARHPDVVGRIGASGSELGLRPDPAHGRGWRTRFELSQAQFAVAGGAGVTTSLVRMPSPYTGYANVPATLDGHDTGAADVATIVRDATPRDGGGAVVRLHDGGGDRARTVEALDRLIAELDRRGYTFSTVGDVLGTSVNHPATAAQHTRGVLVSGVVRVAHVTVTVLAVLLALAGVLLVLRLLLVLGAGYWHIRLRDRRRRDRAPPVTRTVTVLLPAGAVDTVRSVRGGDYPVEVVVVADDSAAGWNAGIAAAGGEVVVIAGAGAVFGPHTVSRLARAFDDPTVGAVAGHARVFDCGDLAGTFRRVDDAGTDADRRVYDVLGCLPTVPGTVGAFRREALLQVGGHSDDTVGPDVDLTMAVRRAGWVVEYDDTATVWLLPPNGFGDLLRQLHHRCYALLQTSWKHRRAVVERGASGRLGRRGLLGTAAFQVLLPLLMPLVEVFLLYGVAFLDPWRTTLAYLGIVAVQAATTVVALRLDREPGWLLVLVPLQQLVARHAGFVVVVRAIVCAVGGSVPEPVTPPPALAAQRAGR